MNKPLQFFKIILILTSGLLFQCKSSGEELDHYVHDQVFVDMMVDLTLVNKIQGKVPFSKRELKIDTLVQQIEDIHGRSIQEFDTYLRGMITKDKAYAEFLDSVQSSRTRLESRLLDVEAEK